MDSKAPATGSSWQGDVLERAGVKKNGSGFLYAVIGGTAKAQSSPIAKKGKGAFAALTVLLNYLCVLYVSRRLGGLAVNNHKGSSS